MCRQYVLCGRRQCYRQHHRSSDVGSTAGYGRGLLCCRCSIAPVFRSPVKGKFVSGNMGHIEQLNDTSLAALQLTRRSFYPATTEVVRLSSASAFEIQDPTCNLSKVAGVQQIRDEGVQDSVRHKFLLSELQFQRSESSCPR